MKGGLFLLIVENCHFFGPAQRYGDMWLVDYAGVSSVTSSSPPFLFRIKPLLFWYIPFWA
jgi:hypothetical protein